MIKILHARSLDQFEAGKALFLEYAESLGFDLCFQGFAEELSNLQTVYSPPIGEMILALTDSEVIGTVGVKKFGERTCEMKRLYVKPVARKLGVGEMLVKESILAAKRLGYQRMYLDTIRDTMKPAISLYTRYGFSEIPSYYPNPLEGVLYMELNLASARQTID